MDAMHSSESRVLAVEVVQRLQARGHQAYFVGGCVRDQLLGLTPKDYDVSTDATPDLLGQYFPGALTVGAHFGVVLVTRNQAQVEVATFRSEGVYSDGRRPDKVRFETDPALDAQRRDFTVNGLMLNPVTEQLLDFVSGRVDLASRTIRAIGDPARRFEEDHLRMLRAVRFASRLNFSVAKDTMQAIRRQADAINRIAAERIRDELIRIFTEGGAAYGLELLDKSSLLVMLLPEVKAFQKVQQPPEFHPEGDLWAHVLLMLSYLNRPSLSLALGVLLHDVGKPPTFRVADRIRFDNHAEVGAKMAEHLLTRLRVPNADMQDIVSLVANHMKFKDVRQMRTSTLKRFLCLPRFNEHLELHRLDCLASNGYTDAYDFVKQKLEELGHEELRPERLISGRDLIAAGFSPSPSFGRALEAVETAQLEGVISTRKQALDLAISVLQAAA